MINQLLPCERWKTIFHVASLNEETVLIDWTLHRVVSVAKMEARVGHLQVIHSYKHCKNMENKIVYKQLSLSGSYVTKPSKVSLQASSQWPIQTSREGGWRGGGGEGVLVIQSLRQGGPSLKKKNCGPLASVLSKNKHIKKYMIYFINH